MNPAPLRSKRAARQVVRETIDHVFHEAEEHAGCHHPAAIDPERDALKASQKCLLAVLLNLPERKLLQLARVLHAIEQAAQHEVDEAERAWEIAHGS